jgi:murein L,D-transpeptidase YafK
VGASVFTSSHTTQTLNIDSLACRMKIFALIVFVLFSVTAHALPKADLVLVKKSEAKLFLMSGGRPIREYRIAMGPRPRGPKMIAGDERTPEGEYILDRKNEKSAFYKSIHISYPNDFDRERAERLGLHPGGSIMIHGQPNTHPWPEDVAQTFNWTSGCIAVADWQMDEIWEAVDEGTPIKIQP